MIETHRYRRLLYAVLCLGLLAALFVAVWRVHAEHQARRVEIAMDAQDFLSFAHAYGYNPKAFLIALRRAGLTSLAVTEELGGNVSTSSHGVVYSGQQVLDQALLAPVHDPGLARLLHDHAVKPDWVYVEAFDRPTYERYLHALRRYFEPKDVRPVRTAFPYVVAARTDLDYFNNLALGLPADQVGLARDTHLLLIPRVQNDERYSPAAIDSIFGDIARDGRVSTIIFFGLRNQVLGFPDQLDATAAAFGRSGDNFGTIEVYSKDQLQKGNLGLARLIPNQVVRVQAIAKLELDKLDLPTVVSRYALGARERNVRVIYLRPFQHEYEGKSIEATNIALVAAIKDALLRDGLRIGRATPFPRTRFWSVVTLLALIAALAVPAGFLLLIEFLRTGPGEQAPGRPLPRPLGRLALILFAATVALMLGALAIHHDLLGRKLAALAAGLTFGTLSFTTLAVLFRTPPPPRAGAALSRGVRALLAAVGTALLGALVIVGLLSHPLLMTEVEAFSGVKLLLLLIPLAALLIALYSPRFGSTLSAASLQSPVRVWELLAGVAVIALGAVLTLRSGNQSDIGPSPLEQHLRTGLTHLLVVRPRTKEFLIGWPSLLLVAALWPRHRRWLAWLLALGAGVGLGDVVDTFSHLHTPLWVGAVRTINGLLLGIAAGAVLVWLYRRFVPEEPAIE
ncbi:MAG: hypothetical protein KGM44_07460 [bacterium]|nr:hypothetical protein [bacterium]